MQEDLEKQVNLKLLSDFMHCIISHSDHENATEQMNRKLKHSIYDFILTKREDNFLSSHNLLYIGEFLVYYKEKGFPSIEDFRAIALALAHTKEFQNPSMFHDTQSDDFIKSIATSLEANFDIYLIVALYNLTPNLEVRDLLLDNIVHAHYRNATDCIFPLMLYTTQKETAELLNIMLPKLCNIFSQPDTLNLGNNIYTYAFAFNIYQTSSLYKKYPQGNLFQHLTSLKEKRVLPKSSAYQRLVKEGYSNKQIKYLNCILPTLFSNENSLDLKRLSYVKNLVEYCKIALEDSIPLSENEQKLLSDLFWNHRSLAKKYDGSDNLLDAVLQKITLQSNENYIWLFTYLRNHDKLQKYIPNAIFVADPLKRAEVYKQMSEKEAYAVLTSFLFFSKSSMKEAIEAFQKCTGFNFLNLYKNNYAVEEDSNKFIITPNSHLFLKLIEAGILSCSDYIEELKRNTLSVDLKKVFRYFLTNGNGKGIIAFLEKFDNEIGIFKIDTSLDFSLYHLFQTKNNYYSSIDCNSFAMRTYLTSERFSKKEKQSLFHLLVKYSYYKCDNNCITFIANFLLNENCDILFSSKELKSMYEKLLSFNSITGYQKDSLNKKFLPKKQYKQITLQQQEKERKEEEERTLANDNHILERIKNDVDDAANPIEKLLSILNSYVYHVSDSNKKFILINDLLNNIIQSKKSDYLQESLTTILAIRQNLYQKGFITFEEFMQSMNTLNKQLKWEGAVQ